MSRASSSRPSRRGSTKSLWITGSSSTSGAETFYLRAIDTKITDEEEPNKDDPEYWLKRADYYRGRSETSQEEEAMRQGLALCPSAPQLKGKVPLQMRARILNKLTHLLICDKRPEVALRLLLAELEEAPVDAASSVSAARLLGFDLPQYLDADEPVLWSWLARRNTSSKPPPMTI